MKLRPSSRAASLSAVSLALALEACSGGGSGACEPGAIRACECAPGVSGLSTCADEGLFWGACDCDGTGGGGASGTGGAGGAGGTTSNGGAGGAGTGGAAGA